MDSPAKTAWLVSIVGGTIAAIIGGIVTFHYEKFYSPHEQTTEQISKTVPTEITKKELEPTAEAVTKPVSAEPPAAEKPEVNPQQNPTVISQCGFNIEFQFAVIQQIFSVEDRDREWIALITRLLNCNNADVALVAASNIFDVRMRDGIYEKIANILVTQNKFDLALKAINQIFDVSTRDRLKKQLIARTR
ncbi:MAG TPA: hypothetical protein VK749_05735 [Xanthobacteraceae bacterium]|jgi:hypothetical protein|nr:hypothetical protein [Xanthobacteraceae bacterium]